MKRLLIVLIAALFVWSIPAAAKDVKVRGYHRKDGTYVKPHIRTSPNRTKSDNYSTRGNVNPHTGKVGTVGPDREVALPEPTPISSSLSAGTSPRSQSDIKEARATRATLSLVTLKMTKDQVAKIAGEPHAKSESAWLYSGAGIIRFKEGLVTDIEPD